MSTTDSETAAPALDQPYFDQLLAHLERAPDSTLARAFARHVHWGYFDEPDSVDDSARGYIAAAEALTRRLCDAAGLSDGMSILDVGCGFGGTVAHMDERFAGCRLTGLNVDPRQLERARRLVRPRAGNRIEFVVGDACALPFADASFDALLAVECVFHFDSRKAFFDEVRRVARPGALLVLLDFILNRGRLAEITQWMGDNPEPATPFYGSNGLPNTVRGYRRLARRAGLRLTLDDDITANTLPTYPAMRRLYADARIADGVESTNYLEQLARRDFVQYHVLGFECPAAGSE